MTVEFFQDRAGGYRWRIVARNGRIVADSGEGYDSESNARRAWMRLRSEGLDNIDERPRSKA